jgi:predicted ferric reductase
MALTNIAFITFLALKNTPLAFLTAYSYERLNVLHQIGGYTTVTFVFLHLTLVSKAFMKLRSPAILLQDEQIHGIIAASAILITLIAAVVIRRLRYELFYIIHIAMYILIIINVGFHKPEFVSKIPIITIVAGGIWGLDRTIRAARILWYSFGNRATITPLPHGGTRIVLSRSPSQALPGGHCFLWIPRVRLIETHPFTIVSVTPNSLEFVVAAYDGFTRNLYQYALKHPGVSLRASVDGPYGAIPNFAKVADKVILVAGGSGASFTFGVALDMIKNLGGLTKTTIDFIWTVKEHGTFHF